MSRKILTTLVLGVILIGTHYLCYKKGRVSYRDWIADKVSSQDENGMKTAVALGENGPIVISIEGLDYDIGFPEERQWMDNIGK